MKPKRISVIPEACAGCRNCEIACAMTLYKVNNPKKAAIRIVSLFPEPAVNSPTVCHQCDPAPCQDACPTGAITRDELGVIDISTETCIMCLACVEVCPWGAMFVHDDVPTPIVCNLCGYSKDETEPACVQWCPKNALKFEPTVAIGDSRRILQAKKMAKVVAEEAGE